MISGQNIVHFWYRSLHTQWHAKISLFDIRLRKNFHVTIYIPQSHYSARSYFPISVICSFLSSPWDKQRRMWYSIYGHATAWLPSANSFIQTFIFYIFTVFIACEWAFSYHEIMRIDHVRTSTDILDDRWSQNSFSMDRLTVSMSTWLNPSLHKHPPSLGRVLSHYKIRTVCPRVRHRRRPYLNVENNRLR